MDLDQLRTFLVVLEHGSFTRAAEALGLSQSTVSFQIKALEGALGPRLLDRGSQRVTPTASGRILQRYAERMLHLRTQALQALSAESEGVAGHVVVAASTIPSEYLLPPALAVLRRTHPGVSVTIEVYDSGNAIAALIGSRCDLALVGTRPADRRVTARPFGTDEVVLVGTPDLPGIDASDAAALRTMPFVLRSESSGTRDAVAELLSRIAPDGPRITVGSSEAAKRCALEGLGLAFVSRHAVADEIVRGRLVSVPLPGLPIPRQFWLARSRGVTLSSAAAALADLLLA